MASLMAFLRRIFPAIFAMPPKQGHWPGPAIPPNADELLGETNAERLKKGVAPLAYSPKLQACAVGHAREVAIDGRPLHEGLNDGDLDDRLMMVGYRGVAAENLGKGYPDAKTTVLAWMDDPLHRSNMLNPRYTEFGGVVAFSPSTGVPFWVGLYGRPST
jgi:uncharacterized protein YkwD